MQDDTRIGLSMIGDLYEQANRLFGDSIAFQTPEEIIEATGHTHWDVREFIKRLDLVEGKVLNDPGGLFMVTFLRARLHGLRFDYGGAVKHYQRAIELAPDKDTEGSARYHLAVTHRVFKKREAAIEEFERVRDLFGLDSDIGMTSAKVAEEMKTEKRGGCFIATAVYGSESAPEVVTLRSFRDSALLSSPWGSALVQAYYRLSPPSARLVSRSRPLRDWVFRPVLWVAVRLVTRMTVNRGRAIDDRRHR